MPGHESDAAWPRRVNAFWFGELDRKDWFTKRAELDSLIRDRFLAVYEQVAGAVPPEAASQADVSLASVIVLDQFPRNMFRDTPRAFATDALAREVASAAIDAGLDAGLAKFQRFFLYLPFEHSESLADQDRSVELITALGDPELTRYAVAHRDIIVRFGRFPHRNAILGRPSTEEELAFLETPGSAF